ncbi:MAG: RNase adapter RapZ [Pyrinomonadaceae bacterium]
MKKKSPTAVNTNDKSPQIVIITGLSGSGMSSATNAFEDLGYFCVDNLPVTMLQTFARLVNPAYKEQGHIERAALVINIREGHFLSGFAAQLKAMRGEGINVFVLFLEASDAALMRRFSETRRPHPTDQGSGLRGAIKHERTTMSRIRALADLITNTSDHTVHTLRHYLVERFSVSTNASKMNVQIISFGHKYGGLRDGDLIFDVRHLPNPYFVEELRGLSGSNRRVRTFLSSKPEVEETVRRFLDLLEYLLPQYAREGKSYVTVGIGCTGGRHRSVMVANELARRLRRADFETVALHRDIRKS